MSGKIITNVKKLSVLICSVSHRAALLGRLMKVLEPQATNDVEILVDRDSGQISIGAKRNKLLQKACGKFSCFVDDDDLVSKEYVKKILNAIEDNPDCVGIEGLMTTNNKNPKKFIHSVRYDSWFEKDDVYYRTPNHLNPVRRELALSVLFPEINHGEDRSYSDRLYPFLKKENYIDDIIYYYLFLPQKKKVFLNNKMKSIETKIGKPPPINKEEALRIIKNNTPGQNIKFDPGYRYKLRGRQ
jgi:glycosyltransferase involved in cell wall biosynthesis